MKERKDTQIHTEKEREKEMKLLERMKNERE